MIRSLVERLVRDTACRRRLPREFGSRPLYLSADSALSYLSPRWAEASKPLLEAAARYTAGASCVWDIGANCGVFSFAAAHVAAPGAEILAVEADPFLASLLQRSAHDRENAAAGVHVLCAAVSDRAGVERFLIAERGRSSNAIEGTGQRSQAGGTRFIQHVPTLTLDGLLAHFSSPAVIKIDVEGAEALVLAGAEQILGTVRPLIYVEVGQRQNADVTSVLRRHDYRLFDGDAHDGRSLEACTFNTLAVPAESSRTNA